MDEKESKQGGKGRKKEGKKTDDLFNTLSYEHTREKLETGTEF
jgi:hypothetical protein